MSKIYFIYDTVLTEDLKIQKVRLGGPFSSPGETDVQVRQYLSQGYSIESLGVDAVEEDEYYYGKHSASKVQNS